MNRVWLGLWAGTLALAASSLVADVRAFIANRDFAAAERLVSEQRARAGVTPETVEAVSWLGRGALAAKQLDAAERYAAETRKLALGLLASRKIDAEPRLPIALGASIEVHAQTLAARGRRSEAVDFLQAELATYRATSMHERIRKNINLLSLEGQRLPPIEAARWLGSEPVPATAWKGRPLLIFLWAHWCSDCKAMAPVIADIRDSYARRGLMVIAPTRLYGYTAGGEDASPALEMKYIDGVRQRYYAGMPSPVGVDLFQTYGVSTTPTIVLVDASGLVRMYHPGAMTRAELASRVEVLLPK